MCSFDILDVATIWRKSYVVLTTFLISPRKAICTYNILFSLFLLILLNFGAWNFIKMCKRVYSLRFCKKNSISPRMLLSYDYIELTQQFAHAEVCNAQYFTEHHTRRLSMDNPSLFVSEYNYGVSHWGYEYKYPLLFVCFDKLFPKELPKKPF